MEALLVLNAGSSNLKWAVYGLQSELSLQARGQLDTLGEQREMRAYAANGRLLEQATLPEDRAEDMPLRTLLTWLAGQDWQVKAVAHRVVHGGEAFDSAIRLDAASLETLRQLSPLAPLHQPAALQAIASLQQMLPGLAQYAAFDTAFHRERGVLEQQFALPRTLTEEGIVRYGFHGLSYASIQRRLPGLLGEGAAGKIVIAHLGNGSSLCALQGGRSLATSMGFTALEGLMMGTRPGRLDPGVILYLQQSKGWSVQQIEAMLYRQSGLMGVSGLSHDLRVLEASSKPEAEEALALYAYMAAKEIGSLLMVLGGLDALVFTGGIGEHSASMRSRICAYLDWLGVEVESAANQRHFTRISTAESALPVLILHSDEEGEIARQVRAIL